MRIHKCYLVVLLFLASISCKKDIQIAFLESDFNTDNNTNVHINIPVATGDIDVSEKINSTIKRNVSKSLQIGELDDENLKSIEERIADFSNELNNFKKDFPESLEEWEAQIDGEILFQSPEIITISITSYINTGGAHGSLYISLLTLIPAPYKKPVAFLRSAATAVPCSEKT